ncbi:MAG: Zn-dependent alcohol dehydrogenase [Candidatus Binatia bacterium]|nr:Zn-dependent alcohol dehydrogenase [Candidatus Binatia bacterium]
MIRVRAAVLDKPGGDVSIREVEVRDPGPGEVRVRIRAAGLCHSDLSVIDGTIPYPTPVVLGHEGAGVVEAVGVGVRSVREGDHIIVSTLAHCGRCVACESGRPTQCRHAPSPKESRPFLCDGDAIYQFANASVFAEATLIREESAIPIDARVPFDRACLIGCGIVTGYGAVVNRAKVETGATMAVFGAGGIGLNCIQGGVLAGASIIVAVDVVEQKLAWASEFGATHVVDARREDPVEAIRALCGGVDYAFEAVGSLPVIRQALDSLAPGGTLTIVGVPPVGSQFSFVVHQLYQNKAILGCRYGAARPRVDFPLLANLYLSGRLKIDELVTREYRLEDFHQALADLKVGALARGVFRFDEKA